MTQPPAEPAVVATEIVLVDAAGRVTTDREQAVRGEITEWFADGTTRSTLFVRHDR